MLGTRFEEVSDFITQKELSKTLSCFFFSITSITYKQCFFFSSSIHNDERITTTTTSRTRISHSSERRRFISSTAFFHHAPPSSSPKVNNNGQDPETIYEDSKRLIHTGPNPLHN
ncbi:hypothetical protein K1719_038207 [Acacia pycnantha]|nr:hypothetical protein K1719_038207 [Acacia pycnantha]